MDDAFARSLDEWNAFYALMGAAAVTLLGLLFVAVSLRLNLFRQREVEDVRDFASFTLATFLAALALAAVAVAPHGSRGVLAVIAGLIALGGLALMTWVTRTWRRLESPAARAQPGITTAERSALGYVVLMTSPYLGLLAAALLLWRAAPAALGLLAVVEVGLLVSGTAAAWLLLSHAGTAQQDGGVG